MAVDIWIAVALTVAVVLAARFLPIGGTPPRLWSGPAAGGKAFVTDLDESVDEPADEPAGLPDLTDAEVDARFKQIVAENGGVR